jgi:hypothetical protein
MHRSIAVTCGALAAAALIVVAGLVTPAAAQEGKSCPTDIPVSPTVPAPCVAGATGGIQLQSAATYAWKAFIAVNWPALAGARDQPDTGKTFGQDVPTVWETMRAKNELYPGNGSATVPPHGVVLQGGKPVNGPDYGYGQAPEYVYDPATVHTRDGRIEACPGQAPVSSPAWIALDETTEIGVNQTYAGVVPAVDPTHRNSQPQLIRYDVKMSKAVYTNVITSQFWYSTAASPLTTARKNYVAALAQGQGANPQTPYVNLAPDTDEPTTNDGIEVKSAWRVLTAAEAASGHFFTSDVRYYEQDTKGTPCWRQATWGLVGMHLITFTKDAPWVIWSTFEQTDNILTADGKPTEDPDGRLLQPMPPGVTPTAPALSSDPNQVNPVITKTGAYCDISKGARLYFRENPANSSTMPAAGPICVNARWQAIPEMISKTNQTGHDAIRAYLAQHGGGASPWLYYKLVNAQGTPVDVTGKDNPLFSSDASYSLANSVIETDYSLGEFAGHLVKGVPSIKDGAPDKDYYNTRLLPFQSARIGFLTVPLRMGGCAGCHGNGAIRGSDFSFALGNNVKEPEPVAAFKTHLFRLYQLN